MCFCSSFLHDLSCWLRSLLNLLIWICLELLALTGEWLRHMAVQSWKWLTTMDRRTAEAYGVIMTLPVLCPPHCTLQWCEGLLPCLLSHSLPAVLLLNHWGGTMVALSQSPGSVGGHAANHQAGTAFSVILLLRNYLGINPKSHGNIFMSLLWSWS